MSKVLVSIAAFAAIAAAWGFAFRALTVFFRRESVRRNGGPTRVQLIDFLALFVALAPALVFLSVAARTGWPP
ncbi:hypothetical protein [Aeoliella sp.]|uniref:hypothetical protein n=1 Tax=Aeoliella sp. TaxID=2795800 RepID=UPI003CCC3EEA